MRLEGKVALITGAASGLQGETMGFGGATAWLFVREGASVVLTDVVEEKGQRTAAQIRDQGGGATFVRLDVTSEQDWVDAVEATVSTYGSLDVLVNNAGNYLPGMAEDASLESWNSQLDVRWRLHYQHLVHNGAGGQSALGRLCGRQGSHSPPHQGRRHPARA